jgi:protein-S-isoprenylcysteine O-methyltransferase Ste14
MSSSPAAAATTAVQPSKRSFIELVTQPAVDRIIAIIACVPFIWMTYYRYTHWPLGIPLLAFSSQTVVLLATMIFRRAPKRLTPNPWFWALAFFATYWAILTLAFMQPGRPLVPASIVNSLAMVGLIVMLWARLSLGRNIGFVPAQREIVTAGAYRYLRHPIYAGLFITMFSVVLRAYSPRNVTLMGMHVALMMIKSVVEERFLSADPQYAAYLQKVKNRWIPFVL